MSLYDYRKALELSRDDPPFYSLIMAAMYKADPDNRSKLRQMFPETWAELDARYHAPGGYLSESERPEVTA